MKVFFNILTLFLALNFAQAQDAENADLALKNEIIRELAVSDADAGKLVNITRNYQAQKQEIQQTFRTDPKMRGDKMKELNDKMNADVRKLLNEQQFKKFMVILLKQP